jgi:hypothetical protein
VGCRAGDAGEGERGEVREGEGGGDREAFAAVDQMLVKLMQGADR